jgi:hypothetical protein
VQNHNPVFAQQLDVQSFVSFRSSVERRYSQKFCDLFSECDLQINRQDSTLEILPYSNTWAEGETGRRIKGIKELAKKHFGVSLVRLHGRVGLIL